MTEAVPGVPASRFGVAVPAPAFLDAAALFGEPAPGTGQCALRPGGSRISEPGGGAIECLLRRLVPAQAPLQLAQRQP